MHAVEHEGLSDTLISLLRRVATEAANAAGRLMRGSFGSLPRVDQTVPHDLKLALDRACETEILRILRASFPGHAVLSEEKGFAPGREPYLWVVDPLDGTVNYYHGIPYFCTSIACYAIADEPATGPGHRLPDGRTLGAPIVGIVYDPLRDELFTGAAGREASLNRGPLRTPEVTRLEEAVVALSFGARQESILYMSRVLPAFALAARKVRSFGSTALDMVQVAVGRIGAFVQMGTNLWDFAAAAVIVQAAGAVVHAKEYAPGRFRIIASARGIFEQVRREAEV
jgi:fructose-1,6-bisphosphatase/inositol monophosphatase family enzyme